MSTTNTVANSSSNNSMSSSIKSQGVRNSTDKVTISRQNSRILKSKDLFLRKKNGVPTKLKSVNSRWETVLNVLLKILILVAVLLLVVQQIWICVDDNGNNSNTVSIPPGVVEFGRRISEFESSIMKMTKIAQDQLNVISEARSQVVHKNANLERDLQNLVNRTNNLETSVTALHDSNFLPKSKFETILSDMKLSSIQISDSHRGSISLDDVRKHARDIVMEEIEKHAADGIGRLDYAVVSGGGRVMKHSKAYNYKFFGIGNGFWNGGIHANAHKMLEPSFGEPGQCFPLQGSSGFVDVKLRTTIIPDAITLEHVAKSVAYDRSSAPKDCHIYGLIKQHSNDGSLDKTIEKAILLKEFSYDLEKYNNAQTFNIEAFVSPVAVNAVRFNFSSNHGSPSHTCIYRLRVHGHEPIDLKNTK